MAFGSAVLAKRVVDLGGSPMLVILLRRLHLSAVLAQARLARKVRIARLLILAVSLVACGGTLTGSALLAGGLIHRLRVA